jgi:PPM family protein phosphatase
MLFSIGNAQHIGARQQQQDAFGFSDPADQAFVSHAGFLGIVADGVGGLTHGSEASRSAVSTFLQAYRQKSPHESIQNALSRALRSANQAVLEVASEPSGERAGTTLAAAVLHNGTLHWISAGDSRIYLLHDGNLTRVTTDHTFARHLDEQMAQGMISREEAQSNSERGSITSYLGQPEPKELDRNTRPLAVQAGDSIIVCSDGFYRALDDSEIVGAFQNGLQQGCEWLVNQAVGKDRKNQDNMTVIALKQNDAGDQSPGKSVGLRTGVLAACGIVAVLIAAWGMHLREKHAGTKKPSEVPHRAVSDTAGQGQTNSQSTAAKPGTSASTAAPLVGASTQSSPAEAVPQTPTQTKQEPAANAAVNNQKTSKQNSSTSSQERARKPAKPKRKAKASTNNTQLKTQQHSVTRSSANFPSQQQNRNGAAPASASAPSSQSGTPAEAAPAAPSQSDKPAESSPKQSTPPPPPTTPSDQKSPPPASPPNANANSGAPSNIASAFQDFCWLARNLAANASFARKDGEPCHS